MAPISRTGLRSLCDRCTSLFHSSQSLSIHSLGMALGMPCANADLPYIVYMSAMDIDEANGSRKRSIEVCHLTASPSH